MKGISFSVIKLKLLHKSCSYVTINNDSCENNFYKVQEKIDKFNVTFP